MYDIEQIWKYERKEKILFLKTWWKTVRLDWKAFTSYFTVWTSIVNFLPLTNPLFIQIKHNMLLQTFIGGFYITFLYPTRLEVPYLNAVIRGKTLILIDIISHQLPFFYFLSQCGIQKITSFSDFWIVNVPILTYIYVHKGLKKYHLLNNDIVNLFMIYSGILVASHFI